MKQRDYLIIDFGVDEGDEGESYLFRDGDEDPICCGPSPHPLNRILKDAREKLGLTQSEMAELMEVSVRSYKNYEAQDVRKVPATALQLLAERTHISPSYLLTGYDPPIDYEAVLGDALSLQHMIWEMCRRPNGNEYGMCTELSPGDALMVATGLLTKRDRQRREQNNSALQVTRADIRNHPA